MRLFLLVACLASVASGDVLPCRWVHLSRVPETAADVAAITNIVATGAASGMNGLLWNAGFDYLGLWPKAKRENLSRVKAFCDGKGVEIVPMLWSVGYGVFCNFGVRNPDDINLAEGLPETDVPYVRRGAKAVYAPGPDAEVDVNGGFERTVRTPRGEFPAQWQALDTAGRFLVLDRSVAHGGKASVRLEAFKDSQDGQARLYLPGLRLKTNRHYVVTGWIKASDDFAPREALRVMAMQNGHVLLLSNVSRTVSGEWSKFTVPIHPCEEGELNLYIGVWGGRSGRLWVDNVRIVDVGVPGVLRREGCPFTVRDAASGRVYEEGRDYAPVAHVKTLLCPAEPKSIELAIPAGSAIREGARLLVTGYSPVTVKDGAQCSTCMSEPRLYELMRRSAQDVRDALHPKTWFLTMDEVRMGGTCAACAARKTDMAHILGDCVTRAHGIIREVSPAARVCIWSDMFNPVHNARGRVYYCKGSFENAWAYVPKDIVMVDWYGAKYGESLPFWKEHGFTVIGATYYDAPLENRAGPDLRELRSYPNVIGAIYTTWRNDYGKLAAFGDLLGRRKVEK